MAADPISAGVSLLAPIAGGVGGWIASSGDRDEAKRDQEAALQKWLSLNVPDIEEQRVALQHYRQTGQLTPQLQQAMQQSQTELGNISLDPTSRAAEMEALSKMQSLANSGGMDAQSKLSVQQAMDTANAQAKAQRDAVLQNAAARGVSGSGMETVAQLVSGQAAANRTNQAGMQAAADAEQRALQAMGMSANLGGQINSQDWNQAQAKAAAADAINRFNTQNAQGVAGSNASALNDAQRYNLDLQQRVSDKNTDVSNQQETHNKGLVQQHFDNQMNLTGKQAGAYGGAADSATKRAGQTSEMFSGIGTALGSGAGAVNQKKSNPGYTSEVA